MNNGKSKMNLILWWRSQATYVARLSPSQLVLIVSNLELKIVWSRYHPVVTHGHQAAAIVLTHPETSECSLSSSNTLVFCDSKEIIRCARFIV